MGNQSLNTTKPSMTHVLVSTYCILGLGLISVSEHWFVFCTNISNTDITVNKKCTEHVMKTPPEMLINFLVQNIR